MSAKTLSIGPATPDKRLAEHAVLLATYLDFHRMPYTFLPPTVDTHGAIHLGIQTDMKYALGSDGQVGTYEPTASKLKDLVNVLNALVPGCARIQFQGATLRFVLPSALEHETLPSTTGGLGTFIKGVLINTVEAENPPAQASVRRPNSARPSNTTITRRRMPA